MSERKGYADIRSIDVSEHVEQKMNLSYLSWAWAHDEMKKIDENSEVIIHEFPDTEMLARLASDGVNITPELAETITINYRKDSAGAYVTVSVLLNGREETESLPVMDFKNKAVKNPDAMQINKAHKRCFVKALALHGLGLYIYAGEDLPEAPPVETVTAQQEKELKGQIEELSEALDDESAKGKTTLWLVGKFGQSGGTLSGIKRNNFKDAKDALQKMIDKNKPEANSEQDEPEQESLLEEQTTQPKNYSEDD